MSKVKKLIKRYSRDFDGRLVEDPNGAWVLHADAWQRDRSLNNKLDAQRLRADTAEAELISANADKEAYAKNAIDLRTSLDAVTLNLKRADELIGTRTADLLECGTRRKAVEAELKKLRSEHFKEAVACVFDNLKIVACNTDDRAWDDRLEDLAEDVIEMAPEYKKEWKDIGDLCRKLAAAEQRIAELLAVLKNPTEAMIEAGNNTAEIQMEHDSELGSCALINNSGEILAAMVDAALNPNPEAESHE